MTTVDFAFDASRFEWITKDLLLAYNESAVHLYKMEGSKLSLVSQLKLESILKAAYSVKADRFIVLKKDSSKLLVYKPDGKKESALGLHGSRKLKDFVLNDDQELMLSIDNKSMVLSLWRQSLCLNETKIIRSKDYELVAAGLNDHYLAIHSNGGQELYQFSDQWKKGLAKAKPVEHFYSVVHCTSAAEQGVIWDSDHNITSYIYVSDKKLGISRSHDTKGFYAKMSFKKPILLGPSGSTLVLYQEAGLWYVCLDNNAEIIYKTGLLKCPDQEFGEFKSRIALGYHAFSYFDKEKKQLHFVKLADLP